MQQRHAVMQQDLSGIILALKCNMTSAVTTITASVDTYTRQEEMSVEGSQVKKLWFTTQHHLYIVFDFPFVHHQVYLIFCIVLF